MWIVYHVYYVAMHIVQSHSSQLLKHEIIVITFFKRKLKIENFMRTSPFPSSNLWPRTTNYKHGHFILEIFENYWITSQKYCSFLLIKGIPAKSTYDIIILEIRGKQRNWISHMFHIDLMIIFVVVTIQFYCFRSTSM